ncbi:MAG: signal peptidase II [Acidobacteriota bacterium]|nr:signal peptidase II [Acidobacteriota bacterium]
MSSENSLNPTAANPQPAASGRKWILFAAVVLTILALDLATKSWALGALEPRGPTIYGLGFIPLTLHFNTGGLWGIGSGSVSRWLFSIASFAALALLVHLYRSTDRRHPLRLITIPMIAAGALGNLVDRLRWDRGVVDFIGPVDLGFMHWPIFNVADMAISCCTILLVISLWRDPGEPQPAMRGKTPGQAVEETPAGG